MIEYGNFYTIEDFKEGLTKYKYDDARRRKVSGESNLQNLKFMCTKCNRLHDGYMSLITHFHIDMITEDMSIKEMKDIEETIYPLVPYNMILFCKDCNEETNHITLDYYIAKIISDLNIFGFKTRFSCEGHDSESLPYIYFENTDQLHQIIKFFDMKMIGTITGITGTKNVYENEKLPYWKIESNVYNLNNKLEKSLSLEVDISSMTAEDYLNKKYIKPLKDYLESKK